MVPGTLLQSEVPGTMSMEGKSTVGFINPVLVRQFSFPAPTVAQWNCILYTVRTVLTVPSSLLHVK